MIDCGKKLYRSEGIRVFGRGKLNICISPTLNLFKWRCTNNSRFADFFNLNLNIFQKIMLNYTIYLSNGLEILYVNFPYLCVNCT